MCKIDVSVTESYEQMFIIIVVVTSRLEYTREL